MASTVFVVDSSFKRTQVKVTPGKYLREVLEEACKARNLDPEAYTLKSQNNKALDLSQPFRLSGLTAGAKLNLTQASRSPSVVSVAIQLPESEGGLRQQDKFASNTSLWLVLRRFEDAKAGASGKKLNLTQRAVPSSASGQGRLLYEQPCLNLLGRKLEGFTDMQKTLTQLGLNGGSVLIRVSFSNSGQPLEEAMQQISDYFVGVDGPSADIGASASQGVQGAHANATPDNVPVANEDTSTTIKDGANVPELPAPITQGTSLPPSDSQAGNSAIFASSSGAEMEIDPPQPSSRAPEAPADGIAVYRPPSSSTPAAALIPDDDTVFEPNVETAKTHQASLQKAGRNQRLLSDKELEEKEAVRQQTLAAIKQVTVRVRYPDQSIIETTATSAETGAELYSKVRDTLARPDEPFELRFTGPKGTQVTIAPSSEGLVRGLGFRGKVLVTLMWTEASSIKARSGPSLKAELQSRAQDLKVELAAQRSTSEAAAGPQARSTPEKSGSGSKMDVEAKMKKFLGFGRK